MKKIFLILVISLSVAIPSYAKSLRSENDIRKLSDDFMAQISKGSYKEAFDMIKPYWPIPEAEINNLAYQTEAQLKMATDRFGKLLGSEYIQSSRIGESYIRYVYIQKFYNHANRWMIVFYRPVNEWKINVIVWDDKAYQLFELKGEQ